MFTTGFLILLALCVVVEEATETPKNTVVHIHVHGDEDAEVLEALEENSRVFEEFEENNDE